MSLLTQYKLHLLRNHSLQERVVVDPDIHKKWAGPSPKPPPPKKVIPKAPKEFSLSPKKEVHRSSKEIYEKIRGQFQSAFIAIVSMSDEEAEHREFLSKLQGAIESKLAPCHLLLHDQDAHHKRLGEGIEGHSCQLVIGTKETMRKYSKLKAYYQKRAPHHFLLDTPLLLVEGLQMNDIEKKELWKAIKSLL